MNEVTATEALSGLPEQAQTFSFLKGGEDVIVSNDNDTFDWEQAASKVREQLGNAMNARNVAFLLGSGCSSLYRGDKQVGIPTMAPMAKAFLDQVGTGEQSHFVTQPERDQLMNNFGLDLSDSEYAGNLERLMEVLLVFNSFSSVAPAIT